MTQNNRPTQGRPSGSRFGSLESERPSQERPVQGSRPQQARRPANPPRPSAGKAGRGGAIGPSSGILPRGFAPLLIVCVAIIVLAGVLSYAITSQYMKETRLKELLVKADRIAEIERTKPPDELRRYTARMYEGLTNAKVFFLEADTETIRKSRYAQKKSDTYARATESESLQWFDIRDTSDRDYARRVLAGERVSAMKHFEFAQDEIIFAGAPILDDDGVVCGGVVLAQPGAELHSL